MNTIQLSLAFIQGQEWLILFLIVLLLFGAKRLPQLARGIGKSAGEFKRARDEFEREIQTSADEVNEPKPAPKAVETASKENNDPSA